MPVTRKWLSLYYNICEDAEILHAGVGDFSTKLCFVWVHEGLNSDST